MANSLYAIVYSVRHVIIGLCDPDWIQTSNRQSRNLIFYSVELRGQYFIYECEFTIIIVKTKAFLQ